MKFQDQDIEFVKSARATRSKGRKLELLYGGITILIIAHWSYLSFLAGKALPLSPLINVFLCAILLRLPLLSGSAHNQEGKLIDFLELKLKENSEDPEA